jgi:hypothetical protein
VTAPEPTSVGRRGPELRNTWQRRSSPLREAEEASELSSRGGRARSHGTRGNARAHLGREARSGAEERVAAPELNSARRRGPGSWATWQHRSSPQQGGEVRGHGTRGGSGAHLYREVWSEATACVATRGCTVWSLS